MTREYWLNLFSVETWEEFLVHGGTTTGFSEARWKTVQQVMRGDYFLCYLTGVSRWVGVLEVVGPAFRSEEPIWSSATYPCRLPARDVIVIKQPEYGVPVLEMRKELSVFDNLRNPNQWSPQDGVASGDQRVLRAAAVMGQARHRRTGRPCAARTGLPRYATDAGQLIARGLSESGGISRYGPYGGDRRSRSESAPRAGEMTVCDPGSV